jgi:eukaryotic-like serine/threonine-protein kinase
MSDLVGATLSSRYRVDKFLGRGGMADVYKVWDVQRAAVLAMKVLHDDLAEDEVFLRRFRREAQTLAKLTHPNIVRFYEMGKDGELVFMLMEYVDGITVSKARTRLGKPFTLPQVLGILQPVCSALHFAHRLGLVHCDIKPANIMLDQTGRVLLTDFGIARVSEGATATMVGAGTPAYMSPEQVSGANPSPQTDIYSLGVVLYHLLTGGERPFTGEKATITGTIAEKIRWEQRNLPPPSPRLYNPEITPELEAVILRCLAKDPRKRYTSATDLLSDLFRVTNAQPEVLPTHLIVRDERVASETLSSVAAVPASAARPRLLYWAVGAAMVIAGLLFALTGGRLLRADASASGGQNPPTAVAQPSVVVVTQIVQVEVTSQVQPPAPPAAPTNPPAPTMPASLSVSMTQDSGGYYLNINGGAGNYDLRLGPLSKGAYVVADNEKFAAYVDIVGNVYLALFEKGYLHTLTRLNKTSFGFMQKRADEPRFDLRLTTNDVGTYVLIVRELNYGGSQSIQITRALTQ